MNKTQAEVLTILQEECAELIQAISKVFRFGIESYNPDDSSINNRDQLKKELADVSTMISLSMFAYGISHAELKLETTRKVERLQKYSKVFDKITTEYTAEEFNMFFADFLNTVNKSASTIINKNKTSKKSKIEKVPKNELN
jgi:NTP pyrophosphatase (non-canonical NTP hydrolase)